MKKSAIIGISGGIDSSWAVQKAVESGLFDITLFTFENGWETLIAESNIRKLVNYYGFPHITKSVPSETFHNIQAAFLNASTPDAECPSDLAIKAYLLDTAQTFNADVIITGANAETEGRMPAEWSMIDYRYLKDVCRRFGVNTKGFPRFNILDTLKYKKLCYNILDGTNYTPDDAKQKLASLYGWEDYGTKHGENVYTRFIKALRFYKFGIDTRVIEFRAKVDAGLMTWDDLINWLSVPACPPEQFILDWFLVEKRLGVRRDEIMALPIKSYRNYKTYRTHPAVRIAKAIKGLFR